jgi:hypothetical protein
MGDERLRAKASGEVLFLLLRLRPVAFPDPEDGPGIARFGASHSGWHRAKGRKSRTNKQAWRWRLEIIEVDADRDAAEATQLRPRI